MTDPETRSTTGEGWRPTSGRCGGVSRFATCLLRGGSEDLPGKFFDKKRCKWCILRHFSRFRVPFILWRISLFIIAIKALMWRVHETEFFLQRKDGARQFFFSWSEGSGYRHCNFLKNGIKSCFLKPFPADCMFCLFLFLGVWGGFPSKPRTGGFVIEDCFLYVEGLCLIKRVRRSPWSF